MATLPRQNQPPPDAEMIKRAGELLDWGFIVMASDGFARLTPKGWSALSTVAEPPIPKPKGPSP